ncbi:MAG TPA: TerB family tellurite resistance protein [Terricaulis sp.]|nr:TerB family tellurite resistance protein [Terricaulis sp.]
MSALISFAAASAPAAAETGAQGALLAAGLIGVVIAWFVWGWLVRLMRAQKAASATGGRYEDFVLEALVNAAKIDGRVNDAERAAIAKALTETAGVSIDPPVLDNAFANAKLGKGELTAYLTARAASFSREQKMGLLKALMAVFVADGRFDESEHAALIDYTAAIGFDRTSAPQMLRGVEGDIKRGNII